jgi:hypothetical protein
MIEYKEICMELWKSQLMSNNKITEIVTDNVFLIQTNYGRFKDNSLDVITELGKYYEILSIQYLTIEAVTPFSCPRMIVVVRKK